MPIPSPSHCRALSFIPSLGLVQRLSLTPRDNILRDVSLAKTTSLPRRLILSQWYPSSGPASAAKMHRTEAENRPRCTKRPILDTEPVSLCRRCGATNSESAVCCRTSYRRHIAISTVHVSSPANSQFGSLNLTVTSEHSFADR